MKEKVVFTIIILVVLASVGTGIYFTLNTDKKNNDKKEPNKVNEVSIPRLNYMEANYNVMVATSLNSYLEDSNENYEYNKIYEIDTNLIVNNHEDIALYDTCEGIVEYQPLDENSYNFTITSNCNNESNKKVTVKGYYNPYDKEYYYLLNNIKTTNNGYIGYFDNAYVEVDDTGSFMMFNSYEMVIYYDNNLNEIERHYFTDEKKNEDISIIEDNKYSILNKKDEEYSLTILDYKTNNKIEVNAPYNLNYLKQDQDNYYYSFWDSIYKLDKNTSELTLIKEATGNEYNPWIYHANNVTYSYYKNNEEFGHVQVYDDNFNVIQTIEFEALDSFRGYVNEEVAISSTWNEDYHQVEIKDINTKEYRYSKTDKELLDKVLDLEYNDKDYNHIVEMNINVDNNGVTLMLTLQYYDSETERMKTDNVIFNIDNEGNEEIVNIYRADYTRDVQDLFSNNDDITAEFGNSYVSNNKYIDFINIRNNEELLLYIIYE